MKLVGLNFETANPGRGSICAAGIALLQDGEVVEKREWLIRPHQSVDWMRPAFMEIHKINYFDLRHLSEFYEVWPVMKNLY